MVRDARVDVHAAVVVARVVVVGQVLIAGHVAGCLSKRQAVPGAFIERSASPRPGASVPAPMSQSASPAALAERVLLDERPEDVGEVLVQGARLLAVHEPGRVLRHAVRELVADDLDRPREGAAGEELPAAVAVDHLDAVPERVVEADAVVDRGHELRALAVDAVAVEHLAVERPRVRGAVEGLVDRDVGDRPVVRAADEPARQVGLPAVLDVVDRLRGRPRARGGARGSSRPMSSARMSVETTARCVRSEADEAIVRSAAARWAGSPSSITLARASGGRMKQTGRDGQRWSAGWVSCDMQPPWPDLRECHLRRRFPCPRSS